MPINSLAGGGSAANIALWNGSAWSALGAGTVLAAPFTAQDLNTLARVSDPQVSPDGRYVVTGGTRANKAYIIDARTLQLVKVIPVDIAPEHLAFSPDGQRLAVALSNRVTVYQVAW